MLFVPQAPGIIPEEILTTFDPRICNTGAVLGAANRAVLMRCTARKSGFLRDITIALSVASGLVDVGIYDTGDTTPTVRTRLGSWAAANAGVAQTCPTASSNPAVTWDPGAGVIPIMAGRQYELAIACDNNTAAFYRYVPGVQTLPGVYWNSAGGVLGKIATVVTAGIALGVLPSSITEANVLTTGAVSFIVGRISPT